jgi:HlyD family secretion protein
VARADAGPARADGPRQDGPDRRTLWVMKDGAPLPLRVRTGISDGSSTEIVEGAVEAGTEVVTDAPAPPSGFAQAMRRPL